MSRFFERRTILLTNLNNIRNFSFLFKNLGHNEYRKFILNSFQAAKISSLIFKEYTGLNHKNVYIVALFHNTGLFLKEFNEILSYLSVEQIEKFNSVNSHSFVSYYLLKRIKFLEVEEVESVLYHHHDFSFDSETRTISSILKLSDIIANQFSKIKFFDDYASIFLELWEIIDGLKIPLNFKNTIMYILKDYKVIESLIDGEPHFELFDFSNDTIDIDSAVEISKIISLIQGMRSFVTRNHISITSRIAQEIAKQCLGEFDSKIMKIAGYLHDIGKLKVPLKILHKKGALDEEEWILMRKHVFDTKETLEKSNLDYLSLICSAHHERLDGSGYPYGLKEEDLFCYQRLLQVSDVYSALIEDRPYRRAYEYKKALEILKEEAEKGKLDGKFVKELEAVVKNEPSLQKASFENVLKDIFEDDYETVRLEFLKIS